MFLEFFYLLREIGLKVTLNQWMTLMEAMDKTNGNRVEAAKLLGLSYVQLNYTLKQLLQNRHKNGHEG